MCLRLTTVTLTALLGWASVVPCIATAEETRPAIDAELLMARYTVSGSRFTFGYRGPLQDFPEIAIYSDGTILTLRRDDAPGQMHMSAISPEIASARFKEFLTGLAGAAPSYYNNCWMRQKDGRKAPYNCIDDAATVNLIFKKPERNAYKAISVYAGYHWREMPEMRDFVPAGYFNLAAWLDGLRDLPSQPWQMPPSGVPGLTASAAACDVAKVLCP
jgi:hypothetical protein